MSDYKNLSMLMDFYELTMANGYLSNNFENKIAYFDMFYRKNPDNAGFSIMSGVSDFLNYIQNLSFSDDDINFLKNKGLFDESFLSYLKNFKLSCDIWCVREGTPIFPGEPIVTVRGPVIEAQLIETMLLLCINHQSLIATKANRMVTAAQGREILEFGARRAQGSTAAVSGARSAYIAGCSATSCTLADIQYGIPSAGTMAHSWVQLFESEYEAFKAYATQYPNNCVLLIDTYDAINSGLPNAIKVFDEVLIPNGYRPKGVRIDSGDITYLSKKIRKMLDDAGYDDCKICASNSLDEYIIRDMIMQGAQVDSFGIGERLITSSSSPVFGGVYKLVALQNDDGMIEPKIKISENSSKITTPGFKKLYRFYSKSTGKALADLITMYDEKINSDEPYEIFDPEHTWKKKLLKDYVVENIRVQILKDGRIIYDMPSIESTRNYCKQQIETLWSEVRRFENPHTYYVDLSKKVWEVKDKLIRHYR